MRTGLLLMRDRRVSPFTKLFALALGATATLVLIAFEVPLEGLLAAVLPLVGMMADAVVDGIEAIILPLVFALLIMPSLVPKGFVASLATEG